MTLDEWQAGGDRYRHRGHAILFHDEGRGEPLLLIHGFPTASADWLHLWPVLAARYRVVAADMIGFGFSDKPRDHDYSILDQADLQEGLLASRGIERFHVLAHDYGDTVAQELLARDNERRAAREGARATSGPEIASVCFLNGGLFPEMHRPVLSQRLLISPLGPLVSKLLSRRTFAAQFSSVFGADTRPTPAELRDYYRLVVAGGGRAIQHKLIRYMEERLRHRARWVGALQETVVPLRLINGPADPVSGRHAAERYRELVPDADVVMLADSIGHYPQVEAPDAVLRAYLEFRRGLSGAAEGAV